MDLFTVLIVLVISVVVCLFLLLVFKFDIREKSYEEALAEQRQQKNALIPKVKTKEKKIKKAAKKVKEQKSSPVEEKIEQTIVTPTTTKPHVEFKPTPEEVQDVVKKPPVKKEKIKPILLNKKKSSENVINNKVQSSTINHFETLHPKDDLELKRANSKDELIKKEPVKVKVATVEPEPVKNVKKSTKSESSVKNVIVIPQNCVVTNVGKEKKKKKSEYNTLQQLTAERDGLINLVRTAELSRTEVQILIDLLLNKQQDAPEITNEWTEGRFDPVQRLKKQLAEKEKALAEEQAALVGAQAKLREIRAEQQQDRLQLQQKIRGLEEVLQAKQIEVQANNNRLHGEVRKLQAQLNEELLRSHQLREELNSLHQFRVTHSQENDKILGQLRNEIEELQQRNQRLQMELHMLNEEKHKTQAYIVQYNNTKQELDQSVEINRQLEEGKKDLERKLEKLLRERNDWKTENVQIQQELYQLHQEHKQLSNNNNDNTKLILQLRNELKIAQEEKLSQMNGTSEESKAHKIELLNLTNELSSVKSDKQTWQQKASKFESELIASNEKCVKLHAELEEQKIKNNELRTKNWKVMEALNAAESKLSLSSKQKDVNVDDIVRDIRNKEQQNQIKFIQSLFPEIKELNDVEMNSNWENVTSKLIRTYLNNLQKQPSTEQCDGNSEEIVKLQAQLQYYKKLIDDTDNILNNIERNVQEEEIKWRSQLAQKDAELRQLKEQVLRNGVSVLENELNSEENVQILGIKNNLHNEVLVNKLSDAQNYNSFSSNGPVS